MGQHIDTIVVGGGQTGLVVGRALQLENRDFLILDAGERVGDSWRQRWDSLHLFTPARYNGLPGKPFPAGKRDMIHKDDLADYLEEYASENSLPIAHNSKVTSLRSTSTGFEIAARSETYFANNVVVAMANYQTAKTPGFAGDIGPAITQLHTATYKNTSQLQPGPTLVVGLGNSGAEIALEVSGSGDTYLAGSPSAVMPFRPEGWFGKRVGVRFVRFMGVKVLTTSTPIGRKALPKMATRAMPLIRVKPRDLKAAGVVRTDRITGVSAGLPMTADGRALDVANIIWCTGFEKGFPWIEMDIFEEDGSPRHDRGISPDYPGLYFCGLHFQHAMFSETLTGVPNDARHIVEHLAANRPSPARPAIH